MNFELGDKVKRVGSEATWTITRTFPRGTVGATLDIQTPGSGEFYYRKITKGQRSRWTAA